MSEEDIIILGGGIAGLATATALAQKGKSVRVFEQASRITEIGAGLQLSPNGSRVLMALGLGDALTEGGIRAQSVRLNDGLSGKQIIDIPMTLGEYRFFHRADLIEILHRSALAAGAKIELGAKVQSLSVSPTAVDISFVDRPPVSAPIVIGADGVHSVARRAVAGAQKPVFTHQVAWRALIRNPKQTVPVANVHVGPGRHLVHYPLAGGRLMNIAAFEERAEWVSDGWNCADNPENLRTAFQTFADPIQNMLEQIEDVHLWGLHGYRTLDSWSNGGLCLIGDAAHPTLPFLGQGANMALEDAYQLALYLDHCPSTQSAFTAFESARKKRTTRIVRAASANARNYHLGGMKRRIAHGLLRTAGVVAPAIVTRPLGWIYDYDATKIRA